VALRAGAVALAAVAALGCAKPRAAAPVPASTPAPASAPGAGAALAPGAEPVVYLVAAREKEQIARSLRAAGIGLAADYLEAPYLLRATLGTAQSSGRCGTFLNLKYSLRRDGAELIGLSGAGWTGECQPNAFDALSARLRAALTGGN
jgi:hypothetical protein